MGSGLQPRDLLQNAATRRGDLTLLRRERGATLAHPAAPRRGAASRNGGVPAANSTLHAGPCALTLTPARSRSKPLGGVDGSGSPVPSDSTLDAETLDIGASEQRATLEALGHFQLSLRSELLHPLPGHVQDASRSSMVISSSSTFSVLGLHCGRSAPRPTTRHQRWMTTVMYPSAHLARNVVTAREAPRSNPLAKATRREVPARQPEALDVTPLADAVTHTATRRARGHVGEDPRPTLGRWSSYQSTRFGGRGVRAQQAMLGVTAGRRCCDSAKVRSRPVARPTDGGIAWSSVEGS